MSDDKLVGNITARLNASLEQMDGATRSRLTQARHRALASRRQMLWFWPAVGSAVAASLVAVILWQGHVPLETESLAVVDYELLSEGDAIELYQEMEFLQWLDMTEQDNVV